MQQKTLSTQGFTAAISLLSALGVAFIGYMSVNLQTDVENLDKKIKHEELMLEIKRFEAEQKKQRDELIKNFVPRLVNGDKSEKDEVLALLFVLYPNDASDILSRIGAALSNDRTGELEKILEKAGKVDSQTGDWGIVISSDGSLSEASYEVQNAKLHNYSANIYLKGRWYATVIGPFPNSDSAERANLVIKTKLNDTAFVVNYKKWCGKQQIIDNYISCEQ